jgi:hypothetical protein
MLIGQTLKALAVIMSAIAPVRASPDALVTPRVAIPEPLPDDDLLSTRCGTYYGVKPRGCPNTKTSWSTHFLKCTTTSTCFKTKTVTPPTTTSTVSTCVIKVETDSACIKTATETTYVTSTTEFVSQVVETQTVTETTTVSETTVPAPDGFVPVQTSFEGSSYDPSTDVNDAALAKREDLAAMEDISPRDPFGEPGSNVARGFAKNFIKNIFCDEWHRPRECTTVHTTCVKTVTAPTPKSIVMATFTSTSTTTPYAVVTSTETDTTTVSVTNIITTTFVETETETETAATLTTSYAACQTNNFANKGPQGQTFGDLYPGFQFDTETVYGLDLLECCIFANVERSDSAHWVLVKDGRCIRVIGQANTCPAQPSQTAVAGSGNYGPIIFGNGLCGEVTGSQ